MLRKPTVLSILACLLIAAAAPAQVMLNEILYDTPQTDDTNQMFTEIYGPPGTNLDGWSLVGMNGNQGGAVYITVGLEGDIPDDGYFVVGGSGVANVDQISPHDLQNAGGASGDGCDGLDLVDDSGVVIDHLCYGTCVGEMVCEGEGGTNGPDAWPQGNTNHSVARIPDHSDTDDNEADWTITDDPTPGIPNSGTPCEPILATLADIRENNGNGVPTMEGDFVIVRGIVNVDNYTLDSLTESNFFFQDEEAGCNVFRGSVPAGIAEGDCVEVSGWVDFYNGLTEITGFGSGNCVFSVEVLDNVDPPAPEILNTVAFFEAFEGMLARIDNVTIVSGDWPGPGQWANITISDGQGQMTMRIDSDTDIPGTPEPDGPFSVVGIITQYDQDSPYNEGYQITPRYPWDVITSAADDPSPATNPFDFTLEGAYPNPFNSTTELKFTVGNARDLTISVFDLLGREVVSEKLSGLTPGSHHWTWTAAGATGLYLARVESEHSVQTAKLLYLK